MQRQFERMQPFSGMQRNMLRDYHKDSDSDFAAEEETNAQVTPFPVPTPIGMAYVPMQQWEEPFDLDTGFVTGTIFPELDYPYQGGGCCV